MLITSGASYQMVSEQGTQGTDCLLHVWFVCYDMCFNCLWNCVELLVVALAMRITFHYYCHYEFLHPNLSWVKFLMSVIWLKMESGYFISKCWGHPMRVQDRFSL